MSERFYLVGLFIISIVATWTFGAVVINTNPNNISAIVLVGVFISLFFALLSICVLIATALWCREKKCTNNHHIYIRAIRHGVLITSMTMSIAVMQWFHTLTWWTAALSICGIILYEVYIIIVRQRF